MYLMKLHHHDRFVSHAGAAWRQLFVVSFFPWLARYRVFRDERYAEAMEDLGERQRQEHDAEQQTNVAVGKAGLRLVLETVDDVVDNFGDVIGVSSDTGDGQQEDDVVDVIGVSSDTGDGHEEDGGHGGNGVDARLEACSETKRRFSI
jgi:hypothetical protein